MSSSKSDLNKSDVTSDSAATSSVSADPDSSSETSAPLPTHENQKPLERRSARKRTQPKRLDPSERTSNLTTTPSPSKRRKKGSKTANSHAETDISVLEFFDVANEWALFAKAHKMVFELVNGAENPYRKKLNDLAQISLEEYRGQRNLGVDVVVAEAWQNVRYCWANPLTDANLREDGSCAYTSMTKESDSDNVESAFAYIAISSAFKENDYRKGQERSTAMDKEDKKTLLFFFRKIKHEFLHVIHRYLGIKTKQTFRVVGTPEKYTPLKQNGRTPKPKVGDHDEEEDSAGPILPLSNKEKLSPANPLCLFIKNKYLPLSDEQVEGLLNLDSSMPVEEGAHESLFFSLRDVRAFRQNILDGAFYKGQGVVRNISKSRRRSRTSSTVSSRSSTSSPMKDTMVDDSDDSSEYQQAAWRRYGNVVITVPSSMFPWLHKTGGGNNQQRPSDGDI